MSLGGDWHEPACELSGICGLKVMGKVKLELEFGWNCAKKILSLKKKNVSSYVILSSSVLDRRGSSRSTDAQTSPTLGGGGSCLEPLSEVSGGIQKRSPSHLSWLLSMGRSCGSPPSG